MSLRSRLLKSEAAEAISEESADHGLNCISFGLYRGDKGLIEVIRAYRRDKPEQVRSRP